MHWYMEEQLLFYTYLQSLTTIDFQRIDFRRIDFRRIDFRRIDFPRIDFHVFQRQSNVGGALWGSLEGKA